MVKQDATQAKTYAGYYGAMVARGKAFTFDSNREVQPTIAGLDDTDDYPFLGVVG